ncbi:hypothetical protein B5S28_g4098 [[Candida] boidinii]|nr:hypothetical protein B5S28_g4098 [[Candida] boidinii]OWB80564.1 hypothetical protein B5S32_g4852 [[Candida] boidinii]
MTITIPTKVRACLFDMDGLLVNSEDVYTISFSEVLESFGKGKLTWDVKMKLQGLPGLKACEKVISEYGLQGVTTPEEVYRLTSERQLELWPKVQFLPGAKELINYLHDKEIPIALATSSNLDKYNLKTKNLQDKGFELFDEYVRGDDERIPAGRGKPFPDIWLIALKGLNDKLIKEGKIDTDNLIKIEECLVFEDGIPGVIAGKSAGAFVIWVPDVNALKLLSKDEVDELCGEDNQFVKILPSLADFDKSSYGL